MVIPYSNGNFNDHSYDHSLTVIPYFILGHTLLHNVIPNFSNHSMLKQKNFKYAQRIHFQELRLKLPYDVKCTSLRDQSSILCFRIANFS